MFRYRHWNLNPSTAHGHHKKKAKQFIASILVSGITSVITGVKFEFHIQGKEDRMINKSLHQRECMIQWGVVARSSAHVVFHVSGITSVITGVKFEFHIQGKEDRMINKSLH